MRISELQFCLRMAKAIAIQFGPNCEVAVYDLQSNDPKCSLIAIENGHVSGLKPGDIPVVVLEALRSDPQNLKDRLAYITKTDDGKALKSSIIYLRDDDGEAIGIFSINFDITPMLAMESAIQKLTQSEESSQGPQANPKNVAALLEELLEQSVRMVGKPVTLMNKEDKVKAIRFLNDSGAFLITKSGPRVCSFFGISKYTLYSYIGEGKNEKLNSLSAKDQTFPS